MIGANLYLSDKNCTIEIFQLRYIDNDDRQTVQDGHGGPPLGRGDLLSASAQNYQEFWDLSGSIYSWSIVASCIDIFLPRLMMWAEWARWVCDTVCGGTRLSLGHRQQQLPVNRSKSSSQFNGCNIFIVRKRTFKRIMICTMMQR